MISGIESDPAHESVRFLIVVGAFLIPYFLMLIICGIPLLYMELAVGQWTQRGPIGALQQLCPFFIGEYAYILPVDN